MTSPRVTIKEYIQGARAPRNRNMVRVAAVGVSTKGEYGKLILINGQDPDDLKYQIGEDTEQGSVGLQASLGEGATDVALARVMGAARKAAATLTITGAGIGADTVTVTIGRADPAFNQTYTATVAASETANSVANEIASAINADAACPVVAVVNGSTGQLVLTAKAAGAAGNDITFAGAETDTATAEFVFAPASGNLANGTDGPTKAYADKTSTGLATLNDLKLTAIGHGPYAASYNFQIIPDATVATRVELLLTDASGELEDESYVLDFVKDALINGGEFAVVRRSKMVRATFTGDITAPLVPTAVAGSLAGGNLGSTISVDDYLDALRILEKSNVNIIFAPYQTSPSIRAAMISQAENATIREGLRVAVLNAGKALDPLAAADETAAYNTNTGSATMVAGWCTFALQPTLPELSVSPDGFYAGKLAKDPMHVSPSARSSAAYFTTVTDVDTPKNSTAEQDMLTDGRLEAIIQDPDGGFHCLNGRTLASDSAHYYMCIRRMANKIKTLLFFASSPLKSEPKDDGLLGSQAGTAEVVLDQLKKAGEIHGGSIIRQYKTANGSRVDYEWLPKYPADEIEYGMYRDALDATAA